MNKKVLGCLLAAVAGGIALFVAVVLLLVMVDTSSESPDFTQALEVPEPNLEGLVIYRPGFKGRFGSTVAGTAFPIRSKDKSKVVMLTASHLVGEAGGLDRDFTGEEIVEGFEELVCQPIGQEFPMIISSRILPTLHAKGMDWSTGAYDLLGFLVEGIDPDNALSVEALQPEVGDPVWLYAEVIGRSNVPELYLAVVVESNEDWLEYAFHMPSLSLRATSGAPVIDRQGRLVAVNLGGYNQDERVYGSGNPISSVRKRLEEVGF